MVNNYAEYKKMYQVESQLWWYKILHYLVFMSIKNSFASKNIKILDAGCGTGGLVKYLTKCGYKNIQGFDISRDAIIFARQHGLDVAELDLNEFNKDSFVNNFDVIVSSDTLYFFNKEKQKQILNNFYDSLNSGGLVILNLPALDSFSGIHDRAVGINKRFDKKSVKEIIDTNKFNVETKRFWPFFLSPIIYILRRMQRNKMKKENIKIESDINLPSTLVNTLLHIISRVELILPFKYPFASSLFLVLKKI